MTRLVVADDDRELLDMLVLLLEELEHEVLAIGRNGHEAVAAAQRERPDVVLMDLRMPEMSGVEAAAVLQESMPGLPVILLSAYDDPGLQERAAAAGVNAYLIKGCSAQSLHAAVLEAANGPVQSSAVQSSATQSSCTDTTPNHTRTAR